MEEKQVSSLGSSGAKEPTLVMKFGGTSVGSSEAMTGVVEIVRRSRPQWPRIVVVISALSGVTNLLLDCAARAVDGDVQTLYAAEARLREMHTAIADQLVADLARRAQVKQEINHLIGEFLNFCQAIAVLGEATPRALDAVAALGERMSVRLLAAVLDSSGIPAQFVEASQLIVTDNCFQNAHPDMEATARQARQVLGALLVQGRVPVVTGFIGATSQGITTTLGRGGSDYSAGILGAALPADDVWIWTDVDGVMSADPRSVPQARAIPELTYREIAELAYFGAKVLHPKTIRPVVEAGVGLRICNTFNPDHPGTRLVADGATRKNGDVKAVTAIRNQRLITVEGRGMLGVPGVAARTFGAVASTGTSVPLITQASSEQSICFAVPTGATEQVLDALNKTFTSELAQRDIDRIWATQEVVIITVVGVGMIHTPGIAGRVFSALGRAGVNVIAIAQGSSEVSISLVVDALDADQAVLTLHDLILEAGHV
jgi:bifunctional aspartokinase / homoserine dehydrogenase 1